MELLFNNVMLQGAGLLLVAAALFQALLLMVRTLREMRHQQQRQQLALELLQSQVETARARHFYTSEELQSWRGQRKFVVANTVRENPSTVSVYLSPHDGHDLPVFRPGQHLVIRFNIPGETQPVNRCYSLSSAHNPDYYRITVKRLPAPPDLEEVAAGRVSAYVNDNLRQGTILDVRAPKGGFYLDMLEHSPLVLLGGGVGVTPFISMLMTLSSQGFQREVWLFYSVRNAEEHVFKDLLELLAIQYPEHFHLFTFYSRLDPDESIPEKYHRGHLDLRFLQEKLPSSNYEFYVCGPPSFMYDMLSGLQDWGVPRQRIRYEAFGSASIKQLETHSETVIDPAGSSDGPTISFSRSGKSMSWDGEASSLLEFGIAKGIAMDWGCSAGECNTCEVAIKGGRVRYLKTPSEAPEEGNCLPCICVPDSEFLEIDA